MNRDHHIYEMSDAELDALSGKPILDSGGELDEEQIAVLREDVARLDGYLKGRADSDKTKRGKGSNRDLAG